MATLGDGMIRRSSPGNGVSTPPLKKYVTCGYFSVSAMRSWRLAGLGDDLPEDLLERLRRENVRAIIARVVLRERDVMDARPVRALEAR